MVISTIKPLIIGNLAILGAPSYRILRLQSFWRVLTGGDFMFDLTCRDLAELGLEELAQNRRTELIRFVHDLYPSSLV